MVKKEKPKFNSTTEMLVFLREMGKRSEAALKKAEAEAKIQEEKYQQERADYLKKYGE